ncbi:DnaJ C-terminal domain-containing protein [Salinisphaera hydrothermalis]|uniref:Heat shock protein DnaJ-like protein n=1 Tax=Salinisphaera hydrothermalis (strain C41B8) TaxID=1304275 RepID=A0A084IJB6_SALHC|nr:DnaJ C-terminal domain-containing protein [Salinisphaera hydrothermalis]KEZ76800.1 heat shock protein DnaJ-like protein [Salinisphaera hydrothermalis C41B8]
MEYKDYYKILGVDRDADDATIKRAYRKLARKYHPDVSNEDDAAEKFREANEAYEVLKDPEKRAAYDQLGRGGSARQDSAGGFQPPPGWDSNFEFRGGGYTGADAGDFSDFFESLFGRGGFRAAGGRGPGASAGGSMRGQDQTARIALDLEDAFQGGQKMISLRVPETDEHGRVVNRERTVRVNIPKGVRAGQQLRLTGQGMPGLGGGEAGDLYLEIEFRPHPLFRLDDRNLMLELPVAPWEAALGATVKTPTPAGPVDLKIPARSNSGRRLRLKGRGMPGKTPGDLIATLKIVLPEHLDDETRALYERLARESDFNPRKKLGV